MPTPQLKIFFDGGCKICSWEVQKYLALDPAGRLGTIDIHAPDFNAATYGLDPVDVRKYFHILTADGRVLAGVDSFIEIWKTLNTPWLLRAAKAAKHRPVRLGLDLGYALFVRIRPFLPRNPAIAPCDDDSCSLEKHRAK